jgi:hypothetical protein
MADAPEADWPNSEYDWMLEGSNAAFRGLSAFERHQTKVEIHHLLEIAEGRVLPSLPGVDEPREDAANRAEMHRRNATRMLLAFYADQI